MSGLTHFDKHGKANMVDITEKDDTARVAIAKGKIKVNKEVYDAIVGGTAAKGDVLGVATTAGIMGAKKTWEMIPMCHMISLGSCNIEFECVSPKEVAETERNVNTADSDAANASYGEIHATCKVKTVGKTGAEMEALTGVSVALLTIYDMCKALDKTMEIGEIYLAEKDGGKSGYILNIK